MSQTETMQGAVSSTTEARIDPIGVGIDIAADSISQERAELGGSDADAARRLLEGGLDSWGWPAGLSAAQLEAVREAARSHLSAIAGGRHV